MNRTFIVAEMACSHEGELRLAKTILETAGRAGADAIQFQIWRRENMTVPTHPDFERLGKLELTPLGWKELTELTRARFPTLRIFACIYDTDGLDLARELGCDGIKVHSSDLSNPALLRRVAATGLPIHLSVGASRLDEIACALEELRGAKAGPVTLMYGYQSFPTRPDDVHLRYGGRLGQLFECPVGYQDHSGGDTEEAFWLPAAAVGMGMSVLEKHLTHDRSRRGIDSEAALDPEPFFRFVRMVRAIDAALGLGRPHAFSADEERYRIYAKKSLVTRRALKRGVSLEESDLMPLRAPSLGLPPTELPSIVGKQLNRDLPEYALISLEDLQ